MVQGCSRLLLPQRRLPAAPRRRRRRRAPLAEAGTAGLHQRPRPRRKPQYGTFGFDIGGHGQERRAGQQFLRIRQRHLGEEHADPRRTSRTTACSPCSTICRANARARSSRSRRRIRTAGSAPPTRASWTRPAVEAKGLAPVRTRGSTRSARLNSQRRACRPLCRGAHSSASALRSAASSARTTRRPTNISCSSSQAGLGMPDRDYYLSKDPKLAETKAKYLQHLTNMLTLAGEPNAAARAKAILGFEDKIAAASWTRVESRDATKTYNKLTLAEFAKSAPGFDFAELVKASGAPERRLDARRPAERDSQASRPSSARRRSASSRTSCWSARSTPTRPTCRRRSTMRISLSTARRSPARRSRRRGGSGRSNFTVGTLGDDVSKLYVARYFPPETKAAADKLVHNIIAAMDRRIDKLDWMSPETKVKAHAKLAAFTPKIGYPSQWRDMSGLAIQPRRPARQCDAVEPVRL